MTPLPRPPIHINDPDGILIRRATRVAIVLPLLFWLCSGPLAQPTVAIFAAFGSFAMLALADFGGTLPRRAAAYGVLTLVGGGLVALGTLASASIPVAAILMLVVGFAVAFAGALGGYYVAAAPSLTLAYVLAATVAAPTSEIPARLAGWVLAGAVSGAAAVGLWPVHERRRIGEAITDACHRLAGALRSDSGDDRAAASDAVRAARLRFWSSPRRPAGPSEHDRALVRLLDALEWLAVILDMPGARRGTDDDILDATATMLDRCGDAVARTETVAADELDLARAAELESLRQEVHSALTAGTDTTLVVTRIRQAFLPRVAAHGAAVAARAATAMRVHPGPFAIGPTLARARRLLLAHLRADSVWFRNSLRMGIALAAAVVIALGVDLPHAFWVALGTLTALRSNTLGTGRSVLAALVGTVAGFGVGYLVISFAGDGALLWAVLPVAVLLSAWAPSALSFVVGQASFTIFVIVLFNLIEPVGWSVGVQRVTDMAVGCGVGLLVSLIFWPRGASAQLRHALASSIEADGRWFAAEIHRLTADAPGNESNPSAEQASARAAQWRADQALIVYLDERGGRNLPVPRAQTLVNAGDFLQLAAISAASLTSRGPLSDAPGIDLSGPSPCRDSAEQIVAGADAAVAVLIAATADEPTSPTAGSLTDAVVRCVAARRTTSGAASVDGVVHFVFAAEWVEHLGRLGERLAPGPRAGQQSGAPEPRRQAMKTEGS